MVSQTFFLHSQCSSVSMWIAVGLPGSFIPGKGMREHESFDELMAANNPALQTMKGAKKTKGKD